MTTLDNRLSQLSTTSDEHARYLVNLGDAL